MQNSFKKYASLVSIIMYAKVEGEGEEEEMHFTHISTLQFISTNAIILERC